MEAAAVQECRATAGRTDSFMTQTLANISSETRVQLSRGSRPLKPFGFPSFVVSEGGKRCFIDPQRVSNFPLLTVIQFRYFISLICILKRLFNAHVDWNNSPPDAGGVTTVKQMGEDDWRERWESKQVQRKDDRANVHTLLGVLITVSQQLILQQKQHKDICRLLIDRP